MKKVLSLLFVLGLVLSACGTSQTQSAPPAQTSTLASTSTSTITPTATQTPIPPTATVTPLPTIPTFTPTFDVSTIVTVTPAGKAECPTIDSTVEPKDYLPSEIEIGFFNIADKILEYLNQGGDGQLLLESLMRIYPQVEYTGGYDYRDVTGDQIPEFLYIEFQFEGKPVIFSCSNRKFEKIAILSGDFPHHAYSMKLEDLNMDGIPEIIVIGAFCGSFCHFTVYIYEWNGENFSNLGQVSIRSLDKIQIINLDGDRTKEIIFFGDTPTCISCSNFIPQRQRTIVSRWNGTNFVEVSNEFTHPEYRFQAIQDADRAITRGKFDNAMQFYYLSINDKNLGWWSPERMTYEQHIANPGIMFIETPSAVPMEDITEYPRLAAYAYYRIMLLQLAQGQEAEAASTYQTLQETFGTDPYAAPYVEMASAFWEAYQSTSKMYDGCAAAIQYAVEHPEILVPLGSDYHGWQSHIYVPGDVCPFR